MFCTWYLPNTLGVLNAYKSNPKQLKREAFLQRSFFILLLANQINRQVKLKVPGRLGEQASACEVLCVQEDSEHGREGKTALASVLCGL